MSQVSGNCAESASVSHAVVQMEMIESWSALVWSSLNVLLYCSVAGLVWVNAMHSEHRPVFALTWMYAGLVENFICDPVADACNSLSANGW
jgi:hypothetical protein